MEIGLAIIWSIWLFVIIYFSVRLAIKPLIKKQEEEIKQDEDFGLVKLRDIEILNNDELEEVIKLYQNKGALKKDTDNEKYQKYAGVLNELKVMGYFTEEQYLNKINKLNEYFNID
ncbi:MAG: hypothetical protein WCQ54_05395 [Clostridiaceae bacterium]